MDSKEYSGDDGAPLAEDDDDKAEDHDGDVAEEGQQVQRKLYLFQCPSMQLSLRRLWDVLPKEVNGTLGMEGYVDLNLRLQRCLTQEFVLERAIDSAIGDWHEDIQEGQRSMGPDDFSMFVFELCSLWCGPNVSLLLYLLFLNTVFLAVTDACGTHTVGLKALEAVEHLPQTFFDLLGVQSHAREADTNSGLTEEQALSAWALHNLSPNNVQSTLLRVQRQVFTVTHDVRSVLLFPGAEGISQGGEDVLGLVRSASHTLAKVQPVDSRALERTTASVVPLPPARRVTTSTALCPQPWCPASYSKQSPRNPLLPSVTSGEVAKYVPSPGADDREAEPAWISKTLRKDAKKRPQMRSHSVGSVGSSRMDRQPPPPPLGRAYDQRPRRDAKNLVLAGQKTLKGPSEDASRYDLGSSFTPLPYTPWFPTVQEDNAEYFAAQQLAHQMSQQEYEQPMTWYEALEPVTSVSHDIGPVCAAAAQNHITDPLIAPTYRLPASPQNLYQYQTRPLLRTLPSDVVYSATLAAKAPKETEPPFQRILRKLPEGVEPPAQGRGLGDGPVVGPMTQPNEPIWFEMAHRLNAILKKAGRRNERRKKRRLRSKLFRGRTRRAPKGTDDGRELREYLDRCAEEFENASAGGPGSPRQGEATGEFLGKVHEKFLQSQGRMDRRPFHIVGVGSRNPFLDSIGKGRQRAQQPVRPIYIPPPLAATSSG